MGNQQSAPYNKISKIIPQAHENAWNETTHWPEKQRARDQLIYAIVFILSANGRKDLSDHEFKLLYSRRPSNSPLAEGEGHVVATLVAIKNGVIEAKIEPTGDGKNSLEAFGAFRKHVEASLNELLETVPDVGSSSLLTRPASPAETLLGAPPPAYEGDGDQGK